jgi:hypothetical protein
MQALTFDLLYCTHHSLTHSRTPLLFTIIPLISITLTEDMAQLGPIDEFIYSTNRSYEGKHRAYEEHFW